ncbi:nucleoredoxin-like protein 2 [Dendroctonus ponderosae]|uniref:Thioredoxin-like fold domain-containing protein n=1 Tax=Dendroctonus ponderosae TaxID=77166 RepID=A0AAR5P2T0_DENPD|nr:nucleoredoxin-like protein 2 [Dendroctonus ponderosae]
MDMLQGKKVMSKDGSLHPIKYVLKNKRILVYLFTASFVNRPEFLQKLRMVYQENLKRNAGMEVVYVSSDTDEKNYKYDFTIRQGPWLAVPFKDPVAIELRYKYDISSLPTVIVVNKEGDIITRSGREELEEIGINVIVTWTEYIQQ